MRGFRHQLNGPSPAHSDMVNTEQLGGDWTGVECELDSREGKVEIDLMI